MSEQIKEQIREAGWWVRMTEWDKGFQGAAVLKRDPRVYIVTDWLPTEDEMWDELAAATTAYVLEHMPSEPKP